MPNHDQSEFNPIEIIDGTAARGIILLGDHAGRDMPAEYGSLGLPAEEFDRHIAYDIGIEPLVRELAGRLDAPAVMAHFSRLLIDANRGEDDPTLIRQLYDGTIVPGNYPMSEAEREKRLARCYRPYHRAVADTIARVANESGRAPFLVSLHSFTPTMQGRPRPWHAGILWDSDDRAVRPILSMLREDPAMEVGDNEPYDGALRGDTMFRHAIVKGYPHVLIEIRQDLIADATGVTEWAARLAPILEAINAMDDIQVIRQFGSRTGPV